MTAKQYLSQVHKLRRQIKSLEDQVEYLTVKAAGVKGIQYGKDKVDASPASVFESTMAELSDAIDKLNARIVKYSKTVIRIEKQVAGMEKPEYVELLTLRYLDTYRGRMMSMEQIARRMCLSVDRVWHLHGEALAEFAKKYMKK